MNEEKSLQERYSPQGVCFGCGQSNEKGLRIRSHARGEEVVLTWQAEKHHEAFPGTVNGGIVGCLFDCHSNWTAAWHFKNKLGLDELPSTVTGEFHVKLMRPTPSTKPIRVIARAIDSTEKKVTIEARLEDDGEVCATCRGVFVLVPKGHPAWHPM